MNIRVLNNRKGYKIIYMGKVLIGEYDPLKDKYYPKFNNINISFNTQKELTDHFLKLLNA